MFAKVSFYLFDYRSGARENSRYVDNLNAFAAIQTIYFDLNCRKFASSGQPDKSSLVQAVVLCQISIRSVPSPCGPRVRESSVSESVGNGNHQSGHSASVTL